MKLTEVHLDDLDILLEGLLDRVPPQLRKTLSGVIAATMLATGHAGAADESILHNRAQETAELVADMTEEEYARWVGLIKKLGVTLNTKEFEKTVGVDFKWLVKRLNDSNPDEMSDELKTADWRLVRHYSSGPENVKRKLWLRPVEQKKAEYAIDYFVERGLPRLSAIALVGGFIQESRLNEKIVNKQSGATGIAQWLGSRLDKMPESAKDNFQGQLQYVMDELHGDEKSAMRRLVQADDLGKAIKAAARYERFNRKGEWGERIGYTDLLYDLYGHGEMDETI